MLVFQWAFHLGLEQQTLPILSLGHLYYLVHLSYSAHQDFLMPVALGNQVHREEAHREGDQEGLSHLAGHQGVPVAWGAPHPYPRHYPYRHRPHSQLPQGEDQGGPWPPGGGPGRLGGPGGSSPLYPLPPL